MNVEITFTDDKTENSYSILLTPSKTLLLVNQNDEAIEIDDREMFLLLDDHFKLVNKMTEL